MQLGERGLWKPPWAAHGGGCPACSTSKNLSDSNIRICPTLKNRVQTRILCLDFKSEYYIFDISIVRTRCWPEFSHVRIVWPEKNQVSVINFLSEFWHCSICPTRIWPEPEFLPALPAHFDFFFRCFLLHCYHQWYLARFDHAGYFLVSLVSMFYP